MVKVALVKKPDLLRENIVQTIQDGIPVETITCYDQEQYHQLYEKAKLPDLLIIDLDTNINTFELIDYCAKQQVKIVVWSPKTEGEQLLELIRQGLAGYFYNEMETYELIFALKTILNGGQYIHPKLAYILINDYLQLVGKEPTKPKGSLTNREWEVLELIVRGQKNCSIGDHLFISPRTVTNHVASILRKLRVPDRTNAALLAVKKGWFVL